MKNIFLDRMTIFLIGVCLGLIIGISYHNMNYKQGQIDAFNGKVKYELILHPDKTTT